MNKSVELFIYIRKLESGSIYGGLKIPILNKKAIKYEYA